ncbi:MAG: hypothetical protein ACTSYW_00380 [Candidatus Heimdallarchaeota archaeon]
MPSKRRLENRSKAFNQRVIEFLFDNWGKGLVTELIDSPKGALQTLTNTKDKGSEIMGRIGSRLWNNALKRINIVTFDDKTWEEYDLVEDDIFITYSDLDFKGDSLKTAKSRKCEYKREYSDSYSKGYIDWFYDLRPYDTYKISLLGGEVPYPEFLGNIEIPCFKELTSHIGWNNSGWEVKCLEVTVLDNVCTLTIPSGDFFTNLYKIPYNIEGYHICIFLPNDRPVRATIMERTSDTEFSISGDKIADGTYKAQISSSIYSHLFSREKNKIYVHSGQDIYVGDIPFYGWTRLTLLGKKKPSSSDSSMEFVDNDIIISSMNGIYRIDTDNDRYYQINTENSTIKNTNKSRKIFGFPDSKIVLDDNPIEIGGFSGVISDEVTPNKTGGALL